MAEYIIMPKLGFNMVTGKIVQWRKKEGDFVEERGVVLEIETDKTIMEVESQVEGVLRKILVPEGEEVEVTLPIAIIGDKKEDISQMIEEALEKLGKKDSIKIIEQKRLKEEEQKETLPVELQKKEFDKKEEEIVIKKISPRAKRKAQELGVQLESIDLGSGVDGAIIERDIIAFNQKSKDVFGEKIAKLSGIAGTKIPYTGMRKIIGDRLSKSKFTAPHLYFTSSIDMSHIVKLLGSFNQKRIEKVSFNDFIIFVVAKTLVEQPVINCSLINDEIVYHDHINIGVAVALEEGLIVPVLNDANQKKVVQISQEVKELVRKARERKLLPEEYEGGTFTVSNLGMYGIENFTAIINPPEAAILSVGQIKKTPIIDDSQQDCDKIEIRSMMKVTLTVDHRLIDGAVAANFLKQLKEYLEFPENILF